MSSVAYQYASRIIGGVPVVEETAVLHNDDSAAAPAGNSGGAASSTATDGARNGYGAAGQRQRRFGLAHHDAVTDLAVIQVGRW